ncbi:hypothetical protein SAMN05444397_101120 [Flavobacterium aquidurense]|uniref:DUF4843 domain-containing protein n=1 Tax=Flavobacterium frigidimaris TaxID=262320 RepID=A0ABX4BLH6_FLAFR|nr:hypothetical protein [Flavobacterium frigidimaris]OXA76634.1 hypothetical protein B0A65_18435 [Flavobacterium frigidimaris]SDY23649.1 hypothetical protein SAMN05444397_101120 [Flavobacterium aquidurense]
MKANILNRIPKILVFAFVFFSCSSDLDFDQVNDLKLKPVFVANLAYFNVAAGQFSDAGTEQKIAFDTRDFDAFKDKFFRDNLVKAEFNFEVENTIVRAFTLDVLLLNDSDQVLQTLRFTVPAYTGSSNVIKYPTEVFESQRLALLKQTTKIGFLVKMASGPPINEDSLGNLKLRSSATVYMEIE